jgi:YesN/AraC family two-component response regulator
MRILIADDERLICEWLQFCIKENPEYEIVGIANNGEQALKMYQTLEPDLVLSDIKMPVMDGLTLLKEVKKINSSAFVILLTAFSDFNYVREAMRENADEYILKTEISNQSFQELLVRIANKIKVKSRQNEDDMQYNGQKHSIVRDLLISEKQITENDISKLKECNIKWRNTGLFALTVWKKRLFNNFTVPKYEHVEHVIGVEYDELIYVLVGNMSKELSDHEKLYSLQEYANMIMNENDCMVGISNITNSLANVNEAVLEAVNALSLGFYKEQTKIYRPINPNKKYKKENESFNMELKHFYQEFYVITGKDQYLFFKKILDYIEENNLLQIKYLKTFCKECFDVIYLRYVNDNTEFSKESLIQAKAHIDEAVYFSEMKQIALKYAVENIWDEDINEKDLSQSIFKAVIFIQQHYNEPISLDQIALEANLNPEYLSRVFKEETGYTYSSFLSNIRMKKAEYLLINTMEKVQSIAEKVGYSNVSYFSTIFKKKYGLNPYEFRRNNANKYVNYDKKIF